MSLPDPSTTPVSGSAELHVAPPSPSCLRTVPPQERLHPGRPAANPAPVLGPAPQEPPKVSKYRSLGLGAAGLGALVLIGSLPVPNYVTGEASVESRTHARDRLTMPRAGIVRIQVARHSRVSPGEIVAQVESPELDQQLAEAERQLEQARGALQTAEQAWGLAQVRQQAQEQEVTILQARAQTRHAQAQAVADGQGVPRSRQIQQEQAALRQEIAALVQQIASRQSEIGAAEHEIAALNSQLEHKRTIHQKRYELTQGDERLLSEHHPLIEGLKTEVLELERRIQAARDRQQVQHHSIAEIHALISQRQRQIAARGEQVQEVARQTQEEFQAQQDESGLAQARSQAVQREVAAAEAEVRARSKLVTQWQQELARLQAAQQELSLRARSGGTVLDTDLDLKDGQRLEAGATILEIANLEELRATVSVRQEDYRLLALGQPVKFQVSGDEPYRAQVSDLAPTIRTEIPGAAPTASVEILIDNQSDRLRPGNEGHAHIHTGRLPMYQKVQHELGKLFNFGRWLPW